MELQEHRTGHRERLRERYLRAGLESFHDYEIVELLLTFGTPRRDVRLMAKELTERLGGLREVLDASPDELTKTKGVGKNNSIAICLVKDILSKYLEKRLENKKFLCRSSKEVFDYLYASMRGLEKEVFKVLYLNVKNNLIKAETAFEGSLTSTSIYPREIVKRAISCKAAALIFAHNHPSGETDPSEADKEITKSLITAGTIMEMKVLDHIIIGNNKYFSFADNSLIREYELLARANASRTQSRV